MIEGSIEFENLFVQKFGDLDRGTLSSLVETRLRFELGGEEDGSIRIKQAVERSNQIMQYCFHESPIWVRVILWGEDEEANLETAGLAIKDADKVFRDRQEEEILYLYFKKYSSFLASPITTSIINYEMAEEPSANVTCYFIDFAKLIIINVYDDRGMDVYSPNKRLIEDISNKFYDWQEA